MKLYNEVKPSNTVRKRFSEDESKGSVENFSEKLCTRKSLANAGLKDMESVRDEVDNNEDDEKGCLVENIAKKICLEKSLTGSYPKENEGILDNADGNDAGDQVDCIMENFSGNICSGKLSTGASGDDDEDEDDGSTGNPPEKICLKTLSIVSGLKENDGFWDDDNNDDDDDENGYSMDQLPMGVGIQDGDDDDDSKLESTDTSVVIAATLENNQLKSPSQVYSYHHTRFVNFIYFSDVLISLSFVIFIG